MSFIRRLFGGNGSTTDRYTTLLLSPERPDATLGVVGEGSYQANLERISGGKTEDGPAKAEHTAILKPEPTNPYDKNAIAVTIDGETVGYLSRENALRYREVVEWADAHDRKVACIATLTGGWDRGDGDTGSFGVALHLGTAGESLVELARQ
jgi:HIRAN domain